MTRIGFIGLGRMGRPMASNLCRKGFHLTVYDINEAAIHELEKLQARGASSVADVAAECDMTEYLLAAQATLAKTARLKVLRLAKEAADRKAEAKVKRASAKKKVAKK